ncbi:hypothetical protein CRG98_031232 [Punica granatum]|uniref:Uncharacterized protein n=1 Tax=Punica granatum TaxID=22663 RepID=A0A2I0IWI6_PUNGR|nr:hypothetical protein CRG98_031232 [Punica granatum]
MVKSSTHISLIALLLSSKPHREALLNVHTATQIPMETAPNKIEETVGSIFSNYISFSDDELPSEGHKHSHALTIVCKVQQVHGGPGDDQQQLDAQHVPHIDP